MDRASSSPAAATPPDLDGLLDALTISRTILASLQEGPQESDTPRQITETKKEIARLRHEVNKARGNPQGPTCPSPPLPTFADPAAGSKRAANSSGTMQSYRSDDYAGAYSASSYSWLSSPPPDEGPQSLAFSVSVIPGYADSVPCPGPSSYSNSGALTPASASTAGSAFGQKKRAFGSHLDDDASSGSRVKSRRTTPSPQHTAITTPSVGDDFWADDADVIDLTGYVSRPILRCKILESLES